MRKIALSNQKGGVAKTTTAVNLAAGLSRHGYRVLLVDMDPQANATFATLGPIEPEQTVYDVLYDTAAVHDVIVRAAHESYDVLPSDINLSGAEVELANAVGKDARLKIKLAGLVYDYLIIDTPPSLGLLTINSLNACDEVIIPVSTSVFALKGIVKLEDTIRKVQLYLNHPELHISGVVCTLYDNTKMAKDILAAVRERFGEKVFATVIPKNVALEEAHTRARSIFDYAPESKGTEAYAQFTEEVIGRG
jgi:chromosome partitioning protein